MKRKAIRKWLQKNPKLAFINISHLFPSSIKLSSYCSNCASNCLFGIAFDCCLYWRLIFVLPVYCKALVVWTCRIRPWGKGEGMFSTALGEGKQQPFSFPVCRQSEKRRKREGKKRPWLTHSLTSYLHIHSCLSAHFFSVTGSQIGWSLLTWE